MGKRRVGGSFAAAMLLPSPSPSLCAPHAPQWRAQARALPNIFVSYAWTSHLQQVPLCSSTLRVILKRRKMQIKNQAWGWIELFQDLWYGLNPLCYFSRFHIPIVTLSHTYPAPPDPTTPHKGTLHVHELMWSGEWKIRLTDREIGFLVRFSNLFC